MNLNEQFQVSLDKNMDSTVEYFLVCGLGNLGQHCVQVLEKFGVHIIGIDIIEKENIFWEAKNISKSTKDNIIVGDCRIPDILKKAKINQCRAVLLVTGDEQVNIEAAFIVREINHKVRLVIRSSQQKMNDELKVNLKNFVAYNANELPVEAIATRALGNESRGFIELDKSYLGVFKNTIDLRHKWRNLRLGDISTKKLIILSHKKAHSSIPTNFYQWENNSKLNLGDEITYIEASKDFAGLFTNFSQLTKNKNTILKNKVSWWKKLREEVGAFLEWVKESAPQHLTKRIFWLVFLIWLAFLICGIFILNSNKVNSKKIDFFDSFYSTLVMLLGAYQDVFPDCSVSNLACQMRPMNLLYMFIGLVFIGMINAWLTQWWLNDKFDLSLANPIPKKDHIVIVGLGRHIGRPVARFLHGKLKQSVVAVSRPLEDSNIVTQVQIVVNDSSNAHTVISDLPNALDKVNLSTAKGIVVLTDDEKLNLEIALMVAEKNNSNKCAIIVRTFDTNFSNKIKTLFNTDKVKFLCVNNIAGAIFVATAFGNEILNILWFNDQMVLVTKYIIKPDDTFNRCLLTEISYKYKIVPIFYENPVIKRQKIFPLRNINLKEGDVLVFLATIESLLKIEQSQKSV